MKKKIGNFKRSLFTFGLSASMVLSAVGVCYAASNSNTYTYDNGYSMIYTLQTTKSGAKATTEAELPNIDAIAFVSIFSYDNGIVKNSASLQDDTKVELSLTSSSVDSFKSFHALKDLDYDPMGSSRSLTVSS